MNGGLYEGRTIRRKDYTKEGLYEGRTIRRKDYVRVCVCVYIYIYICMYVCVRDLCVLMY
jgi:hypothetical protein